MENEGYWQVAFAAAPVLIGLIAGLILWLTN
jgi:hypothetical protein